MKVLLRLLLLVGALFLFAAPYDASATTVTCPATTNGSDSAYSMYYFSVREDGTGCTSSGGGSTASAFEIKYDDNMLQFGLTSQNGYSLISGSVVSGQWSVARA